MKQTLSKLLAGSLLSLASAWAELVPVTTDIAPGTTVTWRATNVYRLDTVVYVQTNATLIIEPGTVIKGATNVVIGREGLPELVSALWVTRGARPGWLDAKPELVFSAITLVGIKVVILNERGNKVFGGSCAPPTTRNHRQSLRTPRYTPGWCRCPPPPA